MDSYALVYGHPRLMRLPDNWGTMTPKQRHVACKEFHQAQEKSIYDTHIKLVDGHDLTDIKEQIGGK